MWIAHRHELLNQALHTFNQNRGVLLQRRSFNYRIISGHNDHDQPVNIQATDDLIIASKDSLRGYGLKYLLTNWVKRQDDLFLVIDEAHHATAKTYRQLIEQLRRHVPSLKILGLTATPIRTSEREHGLLKRVFPDDIVYKIDLRTLIARGILAEPTFRTPKTHMAAGQDLADEDIKRIRQFDLPEELARHMAVDKKRNHLIVKEYVDRIDKNGGYGPTLVFALNIDHAITLDTLFKEYGVKSAFVVSGVRAGFTGVDVSKEQNLRNIQDFRDGKLQVLVNVLILTEGVDLPQAETVFLTRPTISQILMTQMIGRVLRGSEMGGTRQAMIVSFVDDWQDKIHWISPEALLELEVDFTEDTHETRRQFVRLISIAKMQEFARLLDQTIDTEVMDQLRAIDRVPVGLYSFTLQNERQCLVLVYSHHQTAYAALVRDLPDLFAEADLDKNLELSDFEIDRILQIIERRYLQGVEPLLRWRDEDIADMLRYFGEKGAEPPFLEFKDREQFNISRLAREIIDRDIGPRAEADYLMQQWTAEESFWPLYYGHNFKYFQHELILEKNKILYPDTYPTRPPPQIEPTSSTEPLVPRDEVLARDDCRCLCCGESRRNHLQVDHILPRSRGGPNSLDNLQTLCRICNVLKGDQVIDFRVYQTPLSVSPKTFRPINRPHPDRTNALEIWQQYLRRRVNFFYQCAAVHRAEIEANGAARITLRPHNPSEWLHPHIVTWERESGRRPILVETTRIADTTSKQVPTTSKTQEKRLADLPDGTACRFEYRNKLNSGKIQKGQVMLGRKGKFNSFSGASGAVTGTSRNGWKDWELKLPGTNVWLSADEWRKQPD